MELSPGSMETGTRGSSRLITSKDMGGIPGWTADSFRVSGGIIKCTGKEPLSGQMAENMKDSMSTKRNRDMASLVGLTEESIWETGRMESKMGEAYIGIRRELRERDCGVMAKKLSGLIDIVAS